MAILAVFKSFHLRKSLSLVLMALLIQFQLAPAAQAAENSYQLSPAWKQAQFNTAADPLKGMDLQELEAEKQKLMESKSSPEAAALLAVLPGAGHFYMGDNTRGAWVLGGFAATVLLSFLGSYLLSSIDGNIARTAAVFVNIAPTTGYWAWNVTDAYYQTSLKNEKIDQQIRDISLKQKEYGFYSTLLQLHF